MSIHVLDLDFQDVPHTIAAFLVEAPEGPVLVETGPGSTLGVLQRRLAEHGLVPGDIHHVLLTHIHLDHAGAAGWWGQQGATIYVHERGAPHLVDPRRLLDSAGRIYGDQMGPLWGEFLAAPRERVVAVRDNEKLSVAGLELIALDTPGHAGHHHVYRLGDIAFTGDAAGIRLPGSRFIDIPAPPPEFDLERWLATVDRLETERFAALYLTHFGRLDDVRGQLAGVRQRLPALAAFVRERLEAGRSRAAILDDYTAAHHTQAREAGVPDDIYHQYVTSNPLDMSVDGLTRYWRKQGISAST